MTSAVPQRLTFAHGFTLTEMAVVLVIAALLIAGLMIPISTQQEIRARQDTDKTLSEIREALIGFATTNGRLPRPATSSTNGAENSSTCATDAACSGFIPWATLGVEKLDGWKKLIRYSVTPDYANTAITLATIANRTVRSRDAGGSLSYLAGQASCTSAGQCVPAVIFSHGAGRWGTTESGTALGDGSGTNTDEDANNAGPTAYYSRLPTAETSATGGEFDDIVIWLPSTLLTNRLIAAGKLP